jgi:hypothetical protein
MNFTKITSYQKTSLRMQFSSYCGTNSLNCQAIRELKNFTFTAIVMVIPLAEVLVR